MQRNLWDVERQLRDREQRREQLALLPEFWESVYGSGRGHLSLVSGLRPTLAAKLTSVHQAYFAYPAATPAAVRWVEQEAGQDRELYHCSHLLRHPQRRAENAAPLWSLYVDLDTELPDSPLITPTMVVESS